MRGGKSGNISGGKYSNMTNIKEIFLDLLEECEVAGADIYEVADIQM